DFYVSDIKCSKDGASFVLNVDGGRMARYIQGDTYNTNVNDSTYKNGKYNFTTKLIGKNNIKDIAYAIAYGMLKDVAIDEIVSAVKGLEQVKNRLELINVSDDTILINDAYNSNPIGSKSAIDTVSLFDGYKKIIVTPGMVELGDKQYEKNNEMAKHASKYMDEVIVVGETNKEALMDGAGDKALFIKEEKDAIAYAMGEQDKKIILLENDLTDNY
ncbi:MAG: UDP-N-acetylmuramoyl-tripeptide--D-alanyl-D-alanine ligase, partial [Lachnospiraceae bacterium]|nr:UDP-N-acetylmuramoyl-tripeptide--D-alanyl-D-alanine ligase [Lachnospiraceae bacterium]